MASSDSKSKSFIITKELREWLDSLCETVEVKTIYMADINMTLQKIACELALSVPDVGTECIPRWKAQVIRFFQNVFVAQHIVSYIREHWRCRASEFGLLLQVHTEMRHDEVYVNIELSVPTS